ncbi:VRR-NUC domain-containing protein [Massilia sp. YIM B02443]|uniref:VRR-NUC domain-containing protein n=1 Tax=Massilia sp. YIM B02443 TaxID=3050127 RepID=UPI0025B6B2A8|nr:VRR-NUC domain-containing protein [Massilia sp. YIM B02443]MDN4039570.1 VRR-NUC domain-containing protein [Massilia sp. YIM B02443]
MIRVLENEFYYLDNFQRVLDWIGERYADLLDETELAFLAAFPALPQNARALFVRMVMRKGDLFRASKLMYAEIGCPVEAANLLLGTGWIERDPALTLDELFDLLSKPEIAEAFGARLRHKNARKDEQLAALREALCDELTDADQRPFSVWYQDCTDTALRILVKPLCDRLRLIFFGNLHQDWTEFVLSDLGLFRYEQVDISPASRGFRRRADVEHYIQLHACRERFASARDTGETVDQIVRDVPQHAFGNDWLESRREKLLFQIGQHYEKLKDWDGAFDAYARCRFPGARARSIRVLEKHERFEHAYQLLCTAQINPESDAERQHLARIAPRLARKLGHARLPARRAAAVDRIDLCLPLPHLGPWVEGVVRDHLAQQSDMQAPVFYVENALANTLFGLLCWRAVFAAIPGAFFHPFHRGPADLYSADFHQRRAAEFAACLAELDDGSYRDTIRRNHLEKAGLSCPFVHWEAIDADLLELALHCIPPTHLRKWCERILADVKANRTGFPDLIQFWPHEARYTMIEVKGPGDRLQDNQLRWIEYCATHGMPVSVCYLQWEQAAEAPALEQAA